MRFDRRAAMKLTGAMALAATASGPVFAKSQPKRVLILGGTGFIGPHFVKALTDGGHTVTLFNRGKGGGEVPKGVEQLLGDRDGKLEALKGRSWDAVVDNSAYFPRIARMSAELLRPHVPQYIFISSVAAYADFTTVGIDEDYKRAKLNGPMVEDLGGGKYGPMKALCEDAVNEIYGKDATIIRPTYIAGPGDYTDRFTYWPVRVAKGGEMLAPDSAQDPMAYIDARDVADFIRTCVENHVTGAYNLVTPPGQTTMGSLLETSKRVTGANTKITWAPMDFLRAQGLIASGLESGAAFPLWNPPTGDTAGVALVKCDRAVAKGMKFRTLEETIRDTLAWQKTRSPADQKLKAGLPPEREAELLKLLHTA
jgi:2'-hydroxyisoflavone reductase